MNEWKSYADMAAVLYGKTPPITTGTGNAPGSIEHRPGEGLQFRDARTGTQPQGQRPESIEQALYGGIPNDHKIDPAIASLADAVDMGDGERAELRQDMHTLLRSMSDDRTCSASSASSW